MAIRATDAEIRLILDVDPSVTDTTPFIRAANLMVEKILVPCLTVADPVIVEADLVEIENWLAAHFLAVGRDPRIAQEQAGPVREQVHTPRFDLALNNTTYGQMAMTLDVTGKLAEHNRAITAKPKAKDAVVAGNNKVGITHLGTGEYTIPEGY